MVRANLEVVREHSKTFAPPPRPSRTRPLLFASGFLLMLIAAACAVWTRRAFEGSLRELDERALLSAQEALSTVVAREQRLLEATAKTLADDGRVRTTLATPDINAATIEDVLSDLRNSAGMALVGVADPNGRISAMVGADELRGADFGTAKVVKAASSRGSASDVWTLQNRAMLISMAKIVLGSEHRGFLLLGMELDVGAMRKVEERLDLTSALALHDRLAKPAEDAAKQASFEASLALSPGTPHRLDAQKHVVQALQLDEGPAGARVIWAVAQQHDEQLFSSLKRWMLVPAVGMALAGLALLLLGLLSKTGFGREVS